jgi:Asp/Glu/hydantoin racemase
MRLLLVNPNTSTAITAQLAREARACASPGTEVLEATGAFGAEVIATREAAEVGAAAALDAVQRETRRFDAVLLAISLDCGLAALHAQCRVPVVGLSESALLRALQLTERAALVTLGKSMQPLYAAMVAGYGLAERMPWVRATGMTAVQFRADPPAGLVQLRALITEVQHEGAGAVVLAGAVLAGYAPSLQQGCEVPLIDAIPAAVARAEALVGTAATPTNPAPVR